MSSYLLAYILAFDLCNHPCKHLLQADDMTKSQGVHKEQAIDNKEQALAQSRSTDVETRIEGCARLQVLGVMKAMLPGLGVLAFCFLLLLPSLLYQAGERAIWAYDESFYGEITVSSWLKLSSDPLHYLSDFSQCVAWNRPPGIALVGQFFVPLGLAIGSIDFALMLSIAIELVICLALIASIGKQLRPKSALIPLLGALAVASTPQFLELSRHYMVEPLQILSVAYFFWILATFENRRGDRTLAHVLLASSVCLLSKASSPMYCVVPGLVIVGRLFIFHLKELVPKTKTSILFAVSALMVLFAMALWYFTNLQHVWVVVRDASFGDPAVHYGRKAPFFAKVGDWVRLMSSSWIFESLRLVLPVMLTLPLIRLATQGLKDVEDSVSRKRKLLLVTAVIQFSIVIGIMSLNTGADQRYCFALLPAVAVILMVVCSKIPTKPYIAVLTGMFVIQLCSVYQHQFDELTHFYKAIKPSQSVRIDELNRLTGLAAKVNSIQAPLVFGLSYAWLNANTLNYLGKRAQCYGLPPGRAESWNYTNPTDGIIANLEKEKRLVFVGMDPSNMPKEPGNEWVNPSAIPVLNWVRSVGKRIDYESRIGLEVYQIGK